MDGIEHQSNGISIIAATNRLNAIDQALLRPGRFDYKIRIDFPNKSERLEILRLNLKSINYFSLNDDFINFIAEQTIGFSGAELRGLCLDAFYKAEQQKANYVENIHLESVLMAKLRDREKANFKKNNKKTSFCGEKITIA